jgi:hypothetical protein
MLKPVAFFALGFLVFPIGLWIASFDDAEGPTWGFSAHAQQSHADTATPGFRVAGVQVNSPAFSSAPTSDDVFGVELAFFGSSARTSLALEYTREQGGLIGLDGQASTLARFGDDHGTDLKGQSSFFGPFEGNPRLSEDGQHVLFVIPSETQPHAAAARLRAQGELGLMVASKTATVDSEPFDLEVGESLEVGPLAFEITEAGPSAWGDGHSITLSSRKDLVEVVGWALVLDDGTDLELTPSMSMSGMGVWQQTLDFDHEVEHARLRIERWTDLQHVKVPFEVSTGLGLR